MPEHGGAYQFVSGLYRNDVLRFQAVDLGDTVGLSIRVSEEGDSREVTLTLVQLAEYSNAMYAALEQVAALADVQNTRRLLSYFRSGIAENPAKDGA
jgi:hypothetical protein